MIWEWLAGARRWMASRWESRLHVERSSEIAGCELRMAGWTYKSWSLQWVRTIRGSSKAQLRRGTMKLPSQSNYKVAVQSAFAARTKQALFEQLAKVGILLKRQPRFLQLWNHANWKLDFNVGLTSKKFPANVSLRNGVKCTLQTDPNLDTFILMISAQLVTWRQKKNTSKYEFDKELSVLWVL